jgi:hypothetical protein
MKRFAPMSEFGAHTYPQPWMIGQQHAMNGLRAALVRALVGKTPKAVLAKRRHKRRWRRRWLMSQRAVLWVAEHDLNAKPPTELHRIFQEARRSDPAFFLGNACRISWVDRCRTHRPGFLPAACLFSAAASSIPM